MIDVNAEFGGTWAWKEAFRFTVPGSPVGIYVSGKHPNIQRKLDYEEYLKGVRMFAGMAGIKTPLVATRDRPLLIHTVAYFKKGIHPDPENVRKAVSDALFYVTKQERKIGVSKGSGDKFCGGSFLPPLYDRDNPRVVVIIQELCT